MENHSPPGSLEPSTARVVPCNMYILAASLVVIAACWAITRIDPCDILFSRITVSKPSTQIHPHPQQTMENNSPPGSADPSTASELVTRADGILRDCMTKSSIANLNTTIYLLAQNWVDHSSQNSQCLNLLATALLTRFSYTSQWMDVQLAGLISAFLTGLTSDVSRMQRILILLIQNHGLGCEPQKFSLDTWNGDESSSDIVTLAGSILADFHQSVNLANLSTAIALYEDPLSAQDLLGANTSRAHRQLANAHLIKFRATGATKEVRKAISLLRQLNVVQPNHVSCLCAGLLAEYEITNVREVITLVEQTLESEYALEELSSTGTDFLHVFERSGESDGSNLDKAISALETAAVQVTWGHHRWAEIINNLGVALHAQFNRRGDARDLDNAIGLHREALELQSAPHPDRGRSLNNLANVIYVRFQIRGNPGDLDNAIELHQEALALHPPCHADHHQSLNNLAAVLHQRFKTRGDAADLDHSIELHHEALDLCPSPHPERATSLNGLATVLYERFQRRGDTEDLDNAIGFYHEALYLRSAPHSERGMCLNNLAGALHERFETRGDTGDLESAIELHREALNLHPELHPARGTSLNNLATVLHERFTTRGEQRDLDSAIELHSEALHLRPGPHPDRGDSLNNLATVLHERFQSKRDPEDLNNAIGLHHESLELHPASHPNRGISLNNLATALHKRFEIIGELEDLDSAIKLHREALDLRPEAHPERGASLHNLANVLWDRFQSKGEPEDLNSAIGMQHQAVAAYQPPHPHRGLALLDLAHKLIQKYDNCLDFNSMEEAVAAFREGSTYLPSPISRRLRTSVRWARDADKRNHDSALKGYEASIDLLPQHAMVGLDIQSRRKALKFSSTIGLASDAAAYASRNNEITKAVEFLEAGRSVFWSQALQLHTSLDDLQSAHPELAARISNISKQLELGSHRAVASIRMLAAVHKDHMMLDSEDAHYRKLNGEWVEALEEVRQQPGFQRFLRPKLMDVLRVAAIHGPIVILNMSESACTAFIVTLSEDVRGIHLTDLTCDRAQLLVDLLRALLSHSNVQIIQNLTKIPIRKASPEFPPLQERLIGRVEHSKHLDPNKVFGWLLAEIWALIVQPVFCALELKKSDNPSRLWWCPTGPLTFLPIHAAGLYEKSGTDCVSDYVVSSYTPTLASLLDQPTQIPSVFKMTAVIQPTTDDCPNLPDTVEELARIRQQVPAEWLTALGDASPATVDNALQHLHESSVVHFACHGTQDLKNPLETGLHLTDGRLEVSELMQGKSQKKTMSLAFLSACETAKGDETVPDEAMHLAATLLFAGFRSVVATMWTMADPDGPKIAETFYEELFKGCDADANPPILPDLTNAAEALHIAVTKLRADPNIPFSRWVPFVHYGL
ncbi:CHAT domain-containing protein [Mycena epipterygia]|nr:CHAT domain-containing protein [Mycena epipterygia]